MSILRVGRRGGLFLLKQAYGDCVDLAGGSPRRWVLIETAYDIGGRARRILRHMARGGARRQRDNETTTTTKQFLAVVHPPDIRTWKT